MEKDGESSWFKGGWSSDAMWGWKRQANIEDVAAFPVAVSGSNVIQEDETSPKQCLQCCFPTCKEDIQPGAGAGGGSGVVRGMQSVSACLPISHSSDCTEMFELVWKWMGYQSELFSINYFALNFMLVQLHKVIKPRCGVPAGWVL